jgi:hypothetical protein
MDWIFSPAQLEQTPSRDEGVSLDLEKSYRRKTAWFIEELGKESKWLVNVVYFEIRICL